MLSKRLIRTAGQARRSALFFPLLLATALSVPVQAGEESVGHRLTVRIPPILRVETDGFELVFSWNRTVEQAKIRILSNQKDRWQLRIKGGNNGEFPLARVQWSLNGEDWAELSPLPSPLLSGGHTGGWQEIEIHFRLALPEEESAVASMAAVEYHVQLAYDLIIF
ncbi:MAG: hypothetical protein GX085_01260 [Firmicutes bacterium]|nr:hypothetical protein [Bacillota bacterium]